MAFGKHAKTLPEGKLRSALKHPYSNGTTHFLFEPLDLLARLAAMVPRPRVNLTRYHGVFAATCGLESCPANPAKKRTTQTTASNLSNHPGEPPWRTTLANHPGEPP